jgi:tetratricopeptide (TPR) repeat protein
MKNLCIAVLLAAAAVPAHAADPAAVVAAKRELQAAVNAGSAQALLAGRDRFVALSAAEPASADLHVWVAVATWRAVPLVMRDDQEQAKKLCDDGIRRADQALKLEAKSAEALAVKVGLQGLSIGFNPVSGMTLGAEMEETMEQALALAPRNPRVQLFDAINTMHKPKFVGGGPDKALEKFQKAQQLYAAEVVADSTAFDWGRDDAWLWAGRAAMQKKDYARARDLYTKALEVNPSNGWVRHVLLPAADKALAGDGGSESKKEKS